MARVIARGIGSAIALAGWLAVAAAGVARAGECATAADAAALQTRAWQTDLMVAALTCQRHDSYNAFVERFRPALQREGQALKAYFRRTHGAASGREIDRFVTRLANAASQRSIADRTGFCAGTDAAFDSLSVLMPEDFPRWIATRPAPELPDIVLCATQSAP